MKCPNCGSTMQERRKHPRHPRRVAGAIHIEADSRSRMHNLLWTDTLTWEGAAVPALARKLMSFSAARDTGFRRT